MQVIEANKIVGAVLLGLLVWRGTDFVAELVYGETHGNEHEPAYVIAADAEPTPAAEVAAEDLPLASLLAEADPAAGEKQAAKCAACHTFEQGAPHRIGPNLWNVLGRDIAGLDDFQYSEALAALEGEWTFETLDAFLEDPQGYVPGTAMAFPGISKATARADLLAYLRTLSENPVAMPQAPQEAPEPATAAAEEEAPPVEEAEEAAAEPEPEEEVAAQQEAAKEAEPAAPAAENGLAARLAAASADAGESAASICTACHTFEQGGPNRVGPNLWDVVGEPIASVETFNYSQALEGLEGDWTYAKLDDFLADPQSYAPGTRMVFPGVKDDAERADVIAYLRAQSEDPPPLPEQTAAGADKAPTEAETVEQPPAAAAEEPAEAQEAAKAEQASEDEAPAAEAEQPAEPADEGLAARLAEANAEDGKSAARVCTACHTFEQGGPNRVGPNLWDVVGEPIASVETFNYSQALKGLEGDWTYAKLDDFLADPQSYASGTRMVFPGVKDDAERADIIAYLRAQSEDPPPLPGQ